MNDLVNVSLDVKPLSSHRWRISNTNFYLNNLPYYFPSQSNLVRKLNNSKSKKQYIMALLPIVKYVTFMSIIFNYNYVLYFRTVHMQASGIFFSYAHRENSLYTQFMANNSRLYISIIVYCYNIISYISLEPIRAVVYIHRYFTIHIISISKLISHIYILRKKRYISVFFGANEISLLVKILIVGF